MSRLTFAMLSLGVCLLACGRPGGNEPAARSAILDDVKVNSTPEKKSHNAGQNCMACHGPNGNGPGLYQVAGTVYTRTGQPNPNATVELRSAPKGAGDLVLSVQTDSSGNFYSTDSVGLDSVNRFVFVKTPTASREMPFPTESGACNLCHTPALRVAVD